MFRLSAWSIEPKFQIRIPGLQLFRLKLIYQNKSFSFLLKQILETRTTSYYWKCDTIYKSTGQQFFAVINHVGYVHIFWNINCLIFWCFVLVFLENNMLITHAIITRRCKQCFGLTPSNRPTCLELKIPIRKKIASE